MVVYKDDYFTFVHPRLFLSSFGLNYYRYTFYFLLHTINTDDDYYLVVLYAAPHDDDDEVNSDFRSADSADHVTADRRSGRNE